MVENGSKPENENERGGYRRGDGHRLREVVEGESLRTPPPLRFGWNGSREGVGVRESARLAIPRKS
jgi:hypothetical protein